MPLAYSRTRRIAAGAALFAAVVVAAAAGRVHGQPADPGIVAPPGPSIEDILATRTPDPRPILAEPVHFDDRVIASAVNPDRPGDAIWLLMQPCRNRTKILGAYLTDQPCMADSRLVHGGTWCMIVPRQDIPGPRP